MRRTFMVLLGAVSLFLGCEEPSVFDNSLVVTDRQGRERSLTKTPRGYQDMSLSPDGRRLVMDIMGKPGGMNSIWLYDLATDVLSRFTLEGDTLTNEGVTRDPLWAPDGRRIAYVSHHNGKIGLFWKPVDGSGSEERLTTSDGELYPETFSPDGRLLLFDEARPDSVETISAVPLVGEHRPRVVLQKAVPLIFHSRPVLDHGRVVLQAASVTAASFSPDGKWLAYESADVSGQHQVFVRPYPEGSAEWQVSTKGGFRPQWNPRGGELFYYVDDKFMAVPITTSPVFSASAPRMLFARAYARSRHDYAVMPDGDHFIFIRGVGPNTL